MATIVPTVADTQMGRDPAGARIHAAWAGMDRRIDRHPVAVRTLLLAAFLASRLPGLLSLPPFIDEGFMLFATQGILKWPPDLETPLSQSGRLLIVVAIAMARLLVGLPGLVVQGELANELDWLMIGRGTVVLAGAITMLGCFQLGSELYSRRVGLLSAFLYLLLPFAYFHDRMVVAEPFLSACGVWTVVLSLRIVRSVHVSPALLSATIGLGLLSKTPPALFFMVFPLWSWLWFHGSGAESRASLATIARSYAILGVALLASVLVLGLERVDRIVIRLITILADYQLSTARSLGDAVAVVLSHFQMLPGWLLEYLTTPGVLLLAVSVASAALLRERRLCFLLASAGLFVLVFLLAPGWVFPRYLVPGMVLWVPAMAAAAILVLERLSDCLALSSRPQGARQLARALLPAVVVTALMLALLGTSLRFQRLAIVSPQYLPMPDIDRWQYIQGWPAGYGFREALEWVRADSLPSGREVVLAATSVVPLLGRPMGLEVVSSSWWDELGTPWVREKLMDPDRKVYVVASLPGDKIEEALAVPDVSLDLVASYPRPVGVSWVQVYRVTLSPP